MNNSRLTKILADPSAQTVQLPKIAGKIELKKLLEKHKTIVALHAQGVGRHDVARVAGCTPEYVSFIVKQPLAQAYLKSIEEYMEDRMQRLYTRSVDAIADGLDDEDPETRLKAARLQLEASGKMKGSKKEDRTAEDVVAAIMQKATVIIGQNVQVNQSGD